MPAIPIIAVAVAAASATYSAVDANQTRQHAKGAAQAGADQSAAQAAELKKQQDQMAADQAALMPLRRQRPRTKSDFHRHRPA